ncbi:MAG: hypothetical protein AVDCRST_MAG49-3482 [uncultured Thermomicrobiales bacterium]|uniref:Uncharacterized protein n=1 Tax=uncultured Thermomicrobiales bacterium TaxID=1645740 RepID=A0A6J4V922_9BACT|nr:MAG: hypothetical protein AVDCRST_MAG49-3482 [uncultured Thermomicrobiales bacterium]
MHPPVRSRDATMRRFETNMRRIGAISKALPALVGNDGVRADVIRASVVFLHATLEDFIRSSLPKQPARFTFNSRSDLVQALHRMRVCPKQVDDLMVPLASLAKRRIQIVHYADLGETEVEAPAPWTSGDNMVLIHWHLAVASFVYRVRKATGPVGLVEARAGQNCTKARAKLFEFADLTSSLNIGLPRDQILERVEAAGRALDDALGALKLEVEMFLDAEGNPLPDAVLDSDDRGTEE